MIFEPVKAHPLNCAAFGVLTCEADAEGRHGSLGSPMNYTTENLEGPEPEYKNLGEGPVPRPGLIEGFPRQPGGIGANDVADNAGYGGGRERFRMLLDDAWDKAVKQGEKFAQSQHCCWCKEIVVVFRAEGAVDKAFDKNSLEVLAEFEEEPAPDIRKKIIPVKTRER